MGKVINVQMDEDFYNEIIQGGSSGGGEVSSIEYLDLSGLEQNIKGRLIMFAYLLRGNDSGIIAPISFVLNGPDIDMSNIGEFVDMISIDFNMDIYMFGSNMKIKNMFDENIINIIPRITKEQFYSLE